MSRKRSQITQETVTAEHKSSNGLVTVIAVSVIFVVLAAAYNFLTPAVTPQVLHSADGGAPNPDEPAHLLYVESIASGNLPVFSARGADYEAHQPPLYYAVAAVIYRISPTIHCVRFAATLFGLALIWAVFFTVRAALPEQPDAAAGAAALVGLLPMNVSLCASVGNDSAANLIFVLFFLAFTALLRKPDKIARNAALLALVIGAGILTKSSTLLLLPLLVIALLAAVWKKTIPLRLALVAAGTALLGGLVVSLPWLLRNQRLYGDFFAQRVVFRDLAARNYPPEVFIHNFGLQWYLQTFFVWTFESYWAVFDSMNLFLPSGVYLVLALVSAVGMAGGLVTIQRSRRSNGDNVTLVTWAAIILLTIIAFVQYNEHFFQVQGRYLYPSLLPFSAVAVVGLNHMIPVQYRRWFDLALITTMVLLNCLCLSMISGRYSS